MDRLLRIYLTIRAYQGLQNLPPEWQQDIRGMVGWAVSQDELKAQPGIKDDWFVLAKTTTEEEQLLVERNWLYGVTTKRYALILQFFVRTQVPAVSWTPGMAVEATLVFYSSVMPYRALVKEQHRTKSALRPEDCTGWQDVLERETTANCISPFADSYPWIVSGLRPVSHQKSWWLQDREDRLMPLPANFSGLWKMLALSGGAPVAVSVIGKENEYRPVGLWLNNEYLTI